MLRWYSPDTPGPVKSASCVRNDSSNALITSWDSLPSLDISGADPDIVYGVELYKITCGQDIFVNYEVATKNYTSNTIDPYQIYKAVISPRNNVVGARNGTSVIIEGVYDNHYPRYSIQEELQLWYDSTVIKNPLDNKKELGCL